MYRTGVRRISTAKLPVSLKSLEGSATAKQYLRLNHDPSRVNAPTTLPSALDTQRIEGSSKASHLFKVGKAYVKYYKDGIVNVWKNRKVANEIKQRFGISSLDSLYSHVVDASRAQKVKSDVTTPSKNHITRSEFQLVHRTAHDFPKLPTFALFFAITGEFTPLIVLLFPRIATSTCALPYQRRKDDQAINANIELLWELRPDVATDPSPKLLSASVHTLSKNELYALGRVFFQRQTLPISAYPIGIVRRKVQRHIDFVRADTVLLSRFGGVAAMNEDELRLACLNRAITTTGKTVSQLRADLLLWMANFQEGTYDAGFFFYPFNTSEEQTHKLDKVMKTNK